MHHTTLPSMHQALAEINKKAVTRSSRFVLFCINKYLIISSIITGMQTKNNCTKTTAVHKEIKINKINKYEWDLFVSLSPSYKQNSLLKFYQLLKPATTLIIMCILCPYPPPPLVCVFLYFRASCFFIFIFTFTQQT